MFEMFSIIIIGLCFGFISESLSQQLTSLGNVTIPTHTTKETTDTLSYEKLVKNTSGSIYLEFLLNNISNTVPIDTFLMINNKKTAVSIYENGKEPSRGLKIYITKESYQNDSILYKIKFNKIESAITGIYNLSLYFNNNSSFATSYIFSSPIVMKFPKPKLGLEGDPLRILCVYEAYPNATEIIWSLVQGNNFTTANKTTITNTDRIEIREGKDTKLKNDTLFIKSLLKNDTGIYMCTVICDGNQDIALVKINVKDRWAALYPFIGIVIEVVILVTAILVYEKYQIRSQGSKAKAYRDSGLGGDDDAKEPAVPLATGVVGGGGDDYPLDQEDGAVRAGGADLRQRDAISRDV